MKQAKTRRLGVMKMEIARLRLKRGDVLVIRSRSPLDDPNFMGGLKMILPPGVHAMIVPPDVSLSVLTGEAASKARPTIPQPMGFPSAK